MSTFEASGFRLEMAGATDTGLLRQRNEDSIKLIPEQGIAILSDGMGGHLAGNVASRMAVDAIAEELLRRRPEESEGPLPCSHRDLSHALQNANSSIRSEARSRPECSGMGATVVACVFSDQVLVSHLGDSRLYLLANDELTQLTEDHTLAQQYLKQGMINEDEARTWAGRNLLIKGLGIETHVEPDILVGTLDEGYIYLLCSDGLTEVVSDEKIRRTLRTSTGELQEVAQRMIDLANDNGGPDNISVILIRVLGRTDG